jgi:hypothetical protein
VTLKNKSRAFRHKSESPLKKYLKCAKITHEDALGQSHSDTVYIWTDSGNRLLTTADYRLGVYLFMLIIPQQLKFVNNYFKQF